MALADTATVPFIFHVSDSGDPSTPGFQVITIQGDNFGSSPVVFLKYYLSSSWTEKISHACPKSSTPPESGCIYNSNPQFISVVLPNQADLGTQPFAVMVQAGNQKSSPSHSFPTANVVNFPAITQLEFDRIQSGEVFRIFGKNLFLPRGQKPSVDFISSSGKSLPAYVPELGSDSTVLTVTAPEGLTPKDVYRVQVKVGGVPVIANETMTAVPLIPFVGPSPSASPGDYDYGLNVPWQVDLPSRRFQVSAKGNQKGLLPASFYLQYPEFCSSSPASLSQVPGATPSSESTCTRLTNKVAAGDGVTDDQPILQALLFFVSSHVNPDGSTGGVLYLPEGNYVLQSNNANQCGFQLQSTKDRSINCGKNLGTSLQIVNNSVLTIPPNVVLRGAGQQFTHLFYGYGAAPQEVLPKGQVNWGRHASALAFTGPAVTTPGNRAIRSGIENFSLINVNQYNGYRAPAGVNSWHQNSWDQDSDGHCTADEQSKAVELTSAANQWQLALTVDTGNSASLSRPDDQTQVSELFVSGIDFDESHSAGVVDLTASSFGTVDGKVNHLVFQDSQIERGNCQRSWAPLRISGQQISIKGNKINNYYDRNAEIMGDHFVIEGNTFLRHRDRLNFLVVDGSPVPDPTPSASNFAGMNNGGPEVQGSHMIFMNNNLLVQGVPSAFDLDNDFDITSNGNKLSNSDGFGENFNTQDCNAINGDIGMVADVQGTTFTGKSFANDSNGAWWVRDTAADDWTQFPNYSPDAKRVFLEWSKKRGPNQPSDDLGYIATHDHVWTYGSLGHELAIIHGPGAGQVRQIKQYTGSNTLVLDHPWDELPTNESEYAVLAPGITDFLFKGNDIEGSPVGFVIYCGGRNLQFVNNKLWDDGALWLRAFVKLAPIPAPANRESVIAPSFSVRYNPIWNVSVVGNSVSEVASPHRGYPSYPYANLQTDPTQWYPVFPASINSMVADFTNTTSNPTGFLTLGVEMRSNTVSIFPHMLLTAPEGNLGGRGISATAPMPPLTKHAPGPIPAYAMGTLMEYNTVQYLSTPQYTKEGPVGVDLRYQCDSPQAQILSASSTSCNAPTIRLNPNYAEDDFAYSTYGTLDPVIWNPQISTSENNDCSLDPSFAKKAKFETETWSGSNLELLLDNQSVPLLAPLTKGFQTPQYPYYQCTEFGNFK